MIRLGPPVGAVEGIPGPLVIVSGQLRGPGFSDIPVGAVVGGAAAGAALGDSPGGCTEMQWVGFGCGQACGEAAPRGDVGSQKP